MQNLRRLGLSALRERTKGCLCACAVIALLAFNTVPTAVEVVSSPFVREQLSGDNWAPGFAPLPLRRKCPAVFSV